MTATNGNTALIWVTFQKEGIHRYPAAGTDSRLATGGADDVSFLQYPHRHMFHFKVSISVEHDDRDLEFIQVKRWLISLYDGNVLNLDFKSCEMIARELYVLIADRYGKHRTVIIDVSEDGENGAVLTFAPEA